MRIAGMSANSYFGLNMQASSNSGINTLANTSSISSLLGGSSSSSSSSLNYASLFGSSSTSSKADIGDMLTTVYQFSNTLRTSAMSMQNASTAVSGYSADAAAEKKETGSVSSDTVDGMLEAANTFAKSYNSSVNSLYYAPSYSSFVQGIEKDLRGAVDTNLSALKELGFSQDENGALSIDKEAFTKAVQENPDKLQNLFNKNSSFMKSLDQANSQSTDTRSINKNEISLAVQENLSSYTGISGGYGGYYAAQSYQLMASSTLVSTLFNSYA